MWLVYENFDGAVQLVDRYYVTVLPMYHELQRLQWIISTYLATKFSKQSHSNKQNALRMNMYKHYYYLNATGNGEAYNVAHMSKLFHFLFKVTTNDTHSTCCLLPWCLIFGSLHRYHRQSVMWKAIIAMYAPFGLEIMKLFSSWSFVRKLKLSVRTGIIDAWARKRHLP